MQVLTLLLLVVAWQAPAASPQAAADARKVFEQAAGHFAKNENDEALAAYEKAIALDPSRPEYFVGKGRTLARFRRYDEAFAAYGEALKLAPDDPAALRERGHNYINVRKLDLALADLTKAESMKKDDFGIYYHLALARYLTGDYARAAQAYDGCVRAAATDDDRVSCWAWQYPSLRRAGRAADAEALLAKVTPDIKVTESAPYLDRLLLFKGVKTEEQVAAQMSVNALSQSTVGYGIGLWHLLNGRTDKAREYFQKATGSDTWQAFGYIAAEGELQKTK
jgi:tetratricopeptide (TPR) repeat protein